VLHSFYFRASEGLGLGAELRMASAEMNEVRETMGRQVRQVIPGCSNLAFTMRKMRSLKMLKQGDSLPLKTDLFQESLTTML
jgi:hypothetical protein